MAATKIPAGKSLGAAFPIRIGDSATEGNGSYEIYLNPVKSPEQWLFALIEGSAYNVENDQSGGTQQGNTIIEELFQSIKWPSDKTTWENFKSALKNWTGDNGDSRLYLTEYNYNGDNMAKWPAYATGTLTQIQVRVMKVEIVDKGSDVWTFNLGVRRFTKDA